MSVHSEAAQALVGEIRALRQKVPNVLVPAVPGERRKLSASASVPADFVERLAVAAENNPVLAGKGTIDPVEAREQMAYAEAFGPVADELEALVRSLRLSVTTARNKAGNAALRAYALAQRLAARPEHADLVPHVADMRRMLGRKPKVKAEPEEQQPEPKTPASPVPPATTPSKP